MILLENGIELTVDKLKRKCRGLKSQYQSIKDAVEKSGNSSTKWKHFKAMDEYVRNSNSIVDFCAMETVFLLGSTLASDPDVEPEFELTGGQPGLTLSTSSSSSSSSSRSSCKQSCRARKENQPNELQKQTAEALQRLCDLAERQCSAFDRISTAFENKYKQ